MGTSISLWVERRLPSGAWEMVKRQDDHVRSSGHWQTLRPQTADQELLLSYLSPVAPKYNWQLGKNYNLFAILADHRNSRGGEQWTDQIISPPRGLPSDISDEVLADATRCPGSERWTRAQRLNVLLGTDIVAPSWVTLKELLAVDWDGATHGEGVKGESGDFVSILRDEIISIGPPDLVRIVFFFDS